MGRPTGVESGIVPADHAASREAPTVDAPVSFNQEQVLLFQDAVARTGHSLPGATDLPTVLRLSEGVDLRALRSALNALIRRHASLRATYVPTETYDERDRLMQLQLYNRTALFIPGLFRQVIHRQADDVQLHEREVARDVDLDAAILAELSVPLNLRTAPSLRASVIRTGGGSRILVLLMSHLGLDGWSVQMFMRDLSALYLSAMGRGESQLPPVDADCVDFANWQHRQFRSGAFRRHEEFWRGEWESLDDAWIRYRDLPWARGVRNVPRRDEATHVMQHVHFSTEESTVVRETLARYRITPYVFFRSALTIALHHYTRKPRIAFWANLLNRRVPRFTGTMAWCATTNVVTVEMVPGEAWGLLCDRIGRAMNRAQAHDPLPLPALWQRLGRRLDAHDTRVNFDLHIQPPAHVLGRFERQPCHRGVDLDVRLIDGAAGFTLVSGHNNLRYDTVGVARLLSVLRGLVLRLIEDRTCTVADCATVVQA